MPGTLQREGRILSLFSSVGQRTVLLAASALRISTFAVVAGYALLVPVGVQAQLFGQSSTDCSDPQMQQTSACQQTPNSSQGTSYPQSYQQNSVRDTSGSTQSGTGSRDVYTDSGGFPVGPVNDQRANRATMLPEPPTDFQRLVREATGQLLPVFGRELFRMAPSTFAPADQIPVTPDYVIGPGDQIVVRMWGHDNFNGRLTVDRSGAIYIPQIGSIHIAGERFNDLQGRIQQELSRAYRNFQLSVNMGQLRSIQVFVLGEALHPGAYTVSSLSTAFNALLASGGSTPQGSLRKLEVRRGPQTVATIDLYDFVLRGDKSKDVTLQAGDVLFIPAVGAQAALSGSVKHPAIYELKDETTVKDLLDLAGGLTSTASNAHISIDRIEGHRERQALSFAMDATGLATPLRDGDVLQVGSVLASYKDSVTIRGNLANAGRFPWHEGIRLSDIIPDRESLLTNDYWLRRNRLGLPTPLFLPLDDRRAQTDAWGRDFGSGGSQATVNGVQRRTGANGAGSNYQAGTSSQQVRSEGLDDRGDYSQYGQYRSQNDSQGLNSDEMQSSQRAERDAAANRVPNAEQESNFSSLAQQQSSARSNLAVDGQRNEIKVPTPEIDWSYAVIERLDPVTLRSSLIPFNLGRLVIDHDQSQDLLLRPGDVITILSQSDIHVGQDEQTKYIRLEGEFVSSGWYSVGPDETLADVVRRAGGLTKRAYLFGASFTRESARVMQQQRLDEYVTSLSIQIERSSAQRTLSSVSPTALTPNVTGERDLIQQLRGMRATGRIVLEFTPTSTGQQSIPPTPLENGDTFSVPSRPIVVSVVGAVHGQNVFLYQPERRVGDYLQLAGRPTRIADRKHEFIIRADGSIVSRETSAALWSDHFESDAVNPGDTIVVPEKPIKPSTLRDVIDWSQVFSQFAIGAAAIEVIK